MKSILLLSVIAVGFFASSCTTTVPLDPMTMKRSCKMLPGHFTSYGIECDHLYRSSK
jgi:hypothetical protein